MHNNYGDFVSRPTLRELQSWSKIMGKTETEQNQARLCSTLATARAWFASLISLNDIQCGKKTCIKTLISEQFEADIMIISGREERQRWRGF